VSDEILSRIAGWCLADPKLTFVEAGPAVEVAGEPPLRLNLAVTAEEVLLSHRMSLAGAGEGALAQAMSLVNKRGSLMRGTAAAEGGGLAVTIEYPIYLDGLTRQNFLLATQELAATADSVSALGTASPAAAPEPKVVVEPAAFAAPAAMVADTIEMPASLPQPAAVFTPTHEVPAGGMSAWAAPDPNLQPVARLEARVQLRVDERRGAWARVTGSNGWTGWVDDRRLSPLGGAPAAMAAPAVAPAYTAAPVFTPTPAYTTAPMAMPSPQFAVWQPTNEVPAGGMPAWANPDPAVAPIAELAARVQLRIDETRGAWARVTGSNGWTGWVDARRLAPLGQSGGGGAVALGKFALRPLPLIGAIALIVATFLSWIKTTGITGSVGGWDVGLPILWNTNNPGDQPRIGLILLIVGIIGLAAAFIPKTGRGLAAFTGLLGIVIGGLYVIQVIRLFSNLAGASAGDTLSHAIGIGPWVALAGGVLLLIGAMIPERRS
jgi:SH3-like domain-containing protein